MRSSGLRRAGAQRSRGLSLIEVMVVLTLIALLTVLAVPGFQDWIARSRLRSTAESLQNAIRLSQAEAVRTSRLTALALTSDVPEFDATPSDTGSNWFVRRIALLNSDEVPDETYMLQGSTLGTQNNVSISGGPSLLCFDSFGRQASVASANTGLDTECAAGDQSYQLSTVGTEQVLRVQVFLSGRVRLCIYDESKTLEDGYEQGC
jgi:type IV fimbrial biogenesis protein FimT